jgi:hypothetical protein
MGRVDRSAVFGRACRLVLAFVSVGWLGCSGALKEEGTADANIGEDATDSTPPPACPPPADIRRDAPCSSTGLSCPSLESHWPLECGDRGGPRAFCTCDSGRWNCPLIPIVCADEGPPIVDARPDPIVDAGAEADAPPCPPPEAVRNNGPCTLSFLSCPSIENKIPACLPGYEPTTCHCLSKQWSCEVYGISCPDTGSDVRDTGVDVCECTDAYFDAGSDAADALGDAPAETSL